MPERRQSPDPPRRHTGRPARQFEKLDEFESNYALEQFGQRDLMLDLGVLLWIITLGEALLAGRLSPEPDTPLESALRVPIAVVCLLVAVAFLTFFRRLDDQRTARWVLGVSVLALGIQLTLSFYGPGTLGGFQVALVAITIYAAQFLRAGGVSVVMFLMSCVAALAVWQNYRADYAPHLLSQMSLLVVVLWAVAYSLYALKEDRVGALEEAERTAFTDSLTGLPNTRMVRRRAESMLESRNERIHGRVGLILLDLDGFRATNMLRGHSDGDAILRVVASAVQHGAERSEIVGRTGSDEFVVLIGNATRTEVDALAESLRATVLAAIDEELPANVDLDVSIGIAISGEGDSNFAEMMRTADRSMYLEKARHERSTIGRRRGLATDSRIHPAAAPSEAPTRPAAKRWKRLRWSNRPAQSRFYSVAWILSGVAVVISMQMPDAVDHDSLAVGLTAAFAIAMGIFRYATPPSTKLPMQFAEVLIASLTLMGTIYLTGKSSSPAVPIELLILVFIGWFMPLRSIFPIAVVSILIILVPTLLYPSASISLMDVVTLYGGIGVALTMLLILYYNHFYIERAQSLTRQLAWLDPRAGAYNRRAFDERMSDELDRLSFGDRDALAVVMVDLGDFNAVSASHGRRASDDLLSIVAEALAAASRDEDCVARLGGDEFAIVAPGVDAESARALAQRLVSSVREAIGEVDLELGGLVRPSAGFSLYGMHGRTADELVTAADIALTAAKTSSRDPNRVSSFVVSL